MAERTLTIKILGDSASIEKAFMRTTRASGKLERDLKKATGGSRSLAAALNNDLRAQTAAVQRITAAERELIKVRSRRASSVGPFRVAGVGLAAGLGLFSATQAVRELSDRLEATGKEAFTTGGKLRNMVSALTGGNLIGAFDALRAAPKTLADIGFNADQARRNLGALQVVAFGAGNAFRSEHFPTKEQERLLKALHEAQKKAGISSQSLARDAIAVLNAENAATTATDALKDSVARLGQTFVTQSGALVTFKGAVDDLTRAGRGEAVGGLPTPPSRPFHESIGPLSPSQRRELDLIGKEATERIPLLNDRLRQLNGQMKDFHGNQEQRLKILTNIRTTEAEIAGIYKDQAERRRADAASAKAIAESARAALVTRLKEVRAAKLEAIANARERRNAKQFFALGLSPTGGERTPGLENLRKQLGSLDKAVQGTFLDTNKTESLMKRIRKVLSGGFGAVSEDVRATIRDMLQDLRRQLNDFDRKGPLTKTTGLDTKKLLSGLVMDPDLERALRGRLSHFNSAGRAPVGVPVAAGGFVGGRGDIVVQSPIYLDGRQIAMNTTRHQQKLSRRNPPQRRGPNAGRRF